jgi:hypothetical protein
LGAPLAHRIGVYSRAPALRKLDKRTRDFGYMAFVKRDLTEHVGGKPTVVQRMLIDRAAILSLRLAMADARIIADRLTQLDNLQLIAWQNALTRTLTALGVHAEATPAMDALTLARLKYDDEHSAQSAHRPRPRARPRRVTPRRRAELAKDLPRVKSVHAATVAALQRAQEHLTQCAEAYRAALEAAEAYCTGWLGTRNAVAGRRTQSRF